MRSSLLSLLAGTAALAIAASAAQAADLPSRAAPVPVIAAVPVFTWTGFYVGVNAGYGWNTNDNHRYYDPLLAYYGGGGSDGGFVGGAQIGYNYQMGSFVIGLETDLQYADIGGGNQNYYVLGGYYRDNNNGNWFGTVRARAGVAFDRALIYVTGGFAYGDVANGSSAGYYPGLAYYYGSDNGTSTGWTLGGGVEYAFTNNLTAKVEGLYVNLDTKNNYYGYYGDRNNAEFGVIRAGLNYKFSSY